MIGQAKSPEWEARDLFDGRIGIFRFGLCVRVFRSMEELKEWTQARQGKADFPKDLALRAAIGRL